MAKVKTDKKTLELINEVRRQKAEIARAEKPNFRTNCSFSYSENGSGPINLHVENDVRKLLMIASFLRTTEAAYVETAKALEIGEAPPFTWNGSSTNDWVEDIRMRINKIQISTRRKKLETLEARLNAVISPELRAELELQAIQDELGTSAQ